MTIEEIKKFFDNDRFATGIGSVIESAEPGHAVISLNVEDKHLNGNNVVQGGVIFTIADFSCAVAACADGTISVSADGNIAYLRPGTGKKLFAEASCIKAGKKISYYETLISDENGAKIAKASFTMFRIAQ